MCYVDWPPGNLNKPCIYKSCPSPDVLYNGFRPQLAWDIKHCTNITEGVYSVQIGAWNPLDNWVWLDKPFTVEVLARVGPIYIDDFNIINDKNETKAFNFRLVRMGRSTCITVYWGDKSPVQYYGSAPACQARFGVTQDLVKPVDIVSKTFDDTHVYAERGLYQITVTAFDEINYAEALLKVTIFKMPCKVPLVWLPVNTTSWARPQDIPIQFRSKPFQVASMSVVECNVTVVPMLEWAAYQVTLVKDPNSLSDGLMENLLQVQINKTISSYSSAVLSVPPNVLDFGLYKLVFKLSIDTGVPDLPLFRTAFTYVNITRSPLVPGFIQGSVSKVTRGWGQVVQLDATNFTVDPDYPLDKNFNFTWFCRRVQPANESYSLVKDVDVNLDGNLVSLPMFDSMSAQKIPKPRNPIIMSPPSGCYGYGAGPLRWSSPQLTVNTSCFTTYAQIYEVAMVVQKDFRWAMSTILIDVGVIPAPVADIKCASDGLCFPNPSGVMINPTSRLALTSLCKEQCDGGTLYYTWSLNTPGLRLNTVNCNPDLTTTTTVSTSTTTTSLPPTVPPMVKITTASFRDNSTNVTIYAALSPNGTIVVTMDRVTTTNVTTTTNSTGLSATTAAPAAGRRKRQLSFQLSAGQTATSNSTDTGPAPLIPSHIPVGCYSVFPSGRTTPVFAIMTDFFSMNPKLSSFSIELNVTRCIDNGVKVTCSSGINSLNILINTPPVLGTCQRTNLGATEKNDPANPGLNTALLDVFMLRCSGWQDPQSVSKYVFKGTVYVSYMATILFIFLLQYI